MEFGLRPQDRPGSNKRGFTSVRETRKLARTSVWSQADFNSFSASDLEERYPCGLMFYDQPPRCQINLELMEKLAVERLRLLRIIERLTSIYGGKHWHSEFDTALKQEVKRQNLSCYLNVFDTLDREKSRFEVLQNRSRDHFSHFILRLAYCRTAELRRWFISQETELVKYRLHLASPGEIAAFLKLHDLHYMEIDCSEKKLLMSSLNAASGNRSDAAGGMGTNTYFKVHFTEALTLVRSRRVFLKNGLAYVPDHEMKTLLASFFKDLLSYNLALTSKILPCLDEDDRLTQMLSHLDRRYTGDDYSNVRSEGSITADMVKPLAAKHFPLCMRSIQMTLESTHHLKYKGRLQYGLFLKGIGLTMEEAIRYFRGEFVQSHITPDKFDKEYVYNIRYNYGKEGKKVNWAPWNCMRIIMDNVGQGDHHGCPYRHADPSALKTLLVKNGVEGEALSSILQVAKDGFYQKACGQHFCSANQGLEISSSVVEHPNQFYLESLKGGSGSSEAKCIKLKTEKVSLFQ